MRPVQPISLSRNSRPAFCLSQLALPLPAAPRPITTLEALREWSWDGPRGWFSWPRLSSSAAASVRTAWTGFCSGRGGYVMCVPCRGVRLFVMLDRKGPHMR